MQSSKNYEQLQLLSSFPTSLHLHLTSELLSFTSCSLKFTFRYILSSRWELLFYSLCQKVCVCCITTTSILMMIFLSRHVGWRSDIPCYSLQICAFIPLVAFFCLTVVIQSLWWEMTLAVGLFVCGWKYSSHDPTNPSVSSYSTKNQILRITEAILQATEVPG